MSKPILFIIHGMGVHQENDWADEVITTLDDCSKQYNYFNDHTLEDEVEFVPLNYDHILDKVNNNWKDNSDGILEFATSNELDFGALGRGMDFLDNGDDDKIEFFWSHIADVIIYRFFPQYRYHIQSDIINQIAKKINEKWDTNESPNCSVLAHSLGTAVIHDCLHQLGTGHWNGSNVFHPSHYQIISLFMLANTSRLLETEPEAYDSIVRPGTDEQSYLSQYWNFRHELDPVPFPRMFDPEDWLDTTYHSVLIRHYREWNIHGYSHYLENPEVHIPILRSIVNRWAVTNNEKNDAIENFPQFGGQFEGVVELQEKLDELEALRDELSNDPMPSTWIPGFIRFYQILQEMKEIIDEHA